MRTSSKLLATITIAGMTIAGTSAFTGTGLADTTGGSQFIGGTVTQTVTGATLTGIQYSFTDDTHTTVSGIDLTFASGAENHDVSVEASGPAGQGSFYCTSIGFNAAGHSTCSYNTGHGEPGFTGLNSLAVTVSATTTNPT